MRMIFFSSDLTDDPSREIHTELTMQPDQFEEFVIGRENSVTFCLKELRAIIGFADTFALPMSAAFDDGGK